MALTPKQKLAHQERSGAYAARLKFADTGKTPSLAPGKVFNAQYHSWSTISVGWANGWNQEMSELAEGNYERPMNHKSYLAFIAQREIDAPLMVSSHVSEYIAAKGG